MEEKITNTSSLYELHEAYNKHQMVNGICACGKIDAKETKNIGFLVHKIPKKILFRLIEITPDVRIKILLLAYMLKKGRRIKNLNIQPWVLKEATKIKEAISKTLEKTVFEISSIKFSHRGNLYEIKIKFGSNWLLFKDFECKYIPKIPNFMSFYRIVTGDLNLKTKQFDAILNILKNPDIEIRLYEDYITEFVHEVCIRKAWKDFCDGIANRVLSKGKLSQIKRVKDMIVFKMEYQYYFTHKGITQKAINKRVFILAPRKDKLNRDIIVISIMKRVDDINNLEEKDLIKRIDKKPTIIVKPSLIRRWDIVINKK